LPPPPAPDDTTWFACTAAQRAFRRKLRA
jgi:hypothetical protein